MKLALAFASAVLALGAQSFAATVFSQPPTNGAGAIISDTGFGQQAADNFTLGSTSTVTAVRWWGSYGSAPDPSPTDSFLVRFYNTSGGTPNSTAFNTQSIAGLTRTATALTNSVFGSHDGGTVYEYDATLTTPVTFTSGTQYFLSFLNSTGSTWGWSQQSAGTNWFRFGGEGTAWIEDLGAQTGNSSFELIASAVPVPASAYAGIVMLGLLGAARLAKRKANA